MSDIPLSWLQRPLFYSGPVVLHYFYSSFLWTLDKDKNANNVSFVIPANTRSFCGTAWPVFTLLCVWMALWAHSRCGDFIVTPVSLLYCCWCYNIAQCFVQQYNRSSHNGSCDWGGAVFLCPESGVFNLELFPVQWGSVCFLTVFYRVIKNTCCLQINQKYEHKHEVHWIEEVSGTPTSCWLLTGAGSSKREIPVPPHDKGSNTVGLFLFS